MRVLLISSVAPSATSGGHLLLHRHLIGEPAIELGLVLDHSWAGAEPWFHASSPPLWQRLRKTRFTARVQALQRHLGQEFAFAPVVAFARHFRPDLVLTAAHGDLFGYAVRVARAIDRPLVTFFHDWWPDLAAAALKSDAERLFREAYTASRVALCVSANMRSRLGPHPDAPVLLPIPGGQPAPASPHRPSNGKFTLAYAGTLVGVYRKGMEALSHRLADHPRLQLQLWGDAGDWDAAWLAELRRRGIYRGSAAPLDPTFAQSLDGAGALLTHLSFDSGEARRVQTSFPSKLTDYCRRAKPLLLWGPAETAAARWLRDHAGGIVVESKAPDAVVAAAETLAGAPDRARRLAARARELAESEVAPARLQATFLAALRRCC